MNYGQGKKKVYELLDEYSSGGEELIDEDIEKKMVDFFDSAQKLISKDAPIYATYVIRRREGKTLYAPPSGFVKLIRVWRDGSPSHKYRWIAGKLQIPEGDTAQEIMLEYQKLPETLGADGEEVANDYEFEVDEEACEAMPYYVAAQCLFADLMIDYQPYLEEWEKRRMEIRNRGSMNGGVQLRNTFYQSR